MHSAGSETAAGVLDEKKRIIINRNKENAVTITADIKKHLFLMVFMFHTLIFQEYFSKPVSHLYFVEYIYFTFLNQRKQSMNRNEL